MQTGDITVESFFGARFKSLMHQGIIDA
jgi:hypothetical protein